jgi:hypothetical protein
MFELTLRCSRCKPRSPTLGFALRHPNAFAMPVPTTIDKAARALSNSQPVMAAAPTDTSRKLQMALFDWRDQNARLIFTSAVLQNMGSKIFLSDQIISTIVECARADRIGTVDLLYQETRWRKPWMDEFGESILSVVRSFYPPQTLPTAIAAEPTIRRRKPRAPVKCRACGQLGHNSMLFYSFL